MRKSTVALPAAVLIPLLCFAQEPPLPKIETISIRVGTGEGSRFVTGTPHGFTMKNTPARLVIRAAYHVQDSQILGAPDWVGSGLFDIDARFAGTDRVNWGPVMEPFLRNLLADKFQLKVHRERRPLPAYELVVARGGINMSRSQGPECGVFQWSRGTSEPGVPLRCGAIEQGPNQRLNHTLDAAGMRISGGTDLRANLVNFLTSDAGLDRVIVDKTGLAGSFAFHLEWNRQATVHALGESSQSRQRFDPTADPDSPSIFAAVEQQLGLQLRPVVLPVDVLIVDHVAKPAGN